MPGRSVIVAGARTPIGKLSGAFTSLTAMDLGGVAIEGALRRAGISGDQVDYVIMGHVIQAGQQQITSRQAAAKGGIPMHIPSITINKVCLSGLNAIGMADQLIRAGECEVVVAGGMESMTRAPYMLLNARQGLRYGNADLVDGILQDALYDAFRPVTMGESADTDKNQQGISRQDQDEFAARSHELAAKAQKEGIFDNEIVSVSVPQRKGDPIIVTQDEGVRADTTVESLSRLKPAFTKDGTITAGNASQISDGAVALIVMSPEKAAELGCTVLAEVGAHGMVAGPDTGLHYQPSNAIKKAAQRGGIAISDIGLFELNEAFASIGIASARDLGVGLDKVNVNGGAVAIGHPVGASGARIALHAILEMGRRGGGIAAAALCGGGGQGDAILFHVPAA